MIDSLTLAFWSPGPGEMMLIAVVALLLYGGNLPEVARSWGKSFAEFRRGLSGFQNELNEVIYSEPEQIAYRDDTYVDQGYIDESSEETNEHQDESAEQQADVDESEKTVNAANAETVTFEGEGVEDAEEKSAD